VEVEQKTIKQIIKAVEN